jgi:catechol 2,3-dioxygenase-like lactoylglutathione lyase family enzyme
VFQVEQIDHVHVHVADREAAAAWYERVLKVGRDARFAVWAEDPRGPPMLVSRVGDTRIALFAGGAGGSTIAFRVAGGDFLAFLSALPELRLPTERGTLTAADVVDHALAWSVYFSDPDGNPIEITTYDYELVASASR